MAAQDLCAATCGRCRRAEACDDVPPPFGAACGALQAAGNCSDALVREAGWCRATCGACRPGGAAAAPGGGGSGAAASGDNLPQSADGGLALDGSVGLEEGLQCVARTCEDVAPPGSLGCDAVAARGECSAAWMLAAGFCARACGRCSA